MRYVVIVFLLAGCAIKVPEGAGRHFSLQHGSARFTGAMEAAIGHCAKYGMKAQHLGTGRMYPAGAISTFQCVPE